MQYLDNGEFEYETHLFRNIAWDILMEACKKAGVLGLIDLSIIVELTR